MVPADTESDRGRDGPASVTTDWFGFGDKGEIGGGGWKACNLGFELDSQRLIISSIPDLKSGGHTDHR